MTQLLDNGLYAVEVPVDVYGIAPASSGKGVYYEYPNPRNESGCNIVECDFEPTIIGIFKDLSEEQCKEIYQPPLGTMAWSFKVALSAKMKSKGLTPDTKNYLIIKSNHVNN